MGDAGGVACLALEDVAVDAVGGGFLSVLAGSALVHEATGVLVLLGIEHVGAFGAEEDRDGHVAVLLWGLGGGRAGLLR